MLSITDYISQIHTWLQLPRVLNRDFAVEYLLSYAAWANRMDNRELIRVAKEAKATSLELSSVSEDDIVLLNDFESLERLSLFEFAGDFSILPRVPKLYSVAMIEGCEPEDFQYLANVRTLRSLAINHWGPEDLSGIGQIDQLVELSLSENEQYNSIRFVAQLINLEILDLADGQFEDLAPVEGLTRLRKLNIANCNEVINLSPIAGLTSLIDLDIGSTSATDLSPLASLSNLKSLKFGGDVDSVDPIRQLTNLTSLEISYCKTITDFSFLSQFKRLTNLTLNSTLIDDLSPISPLEQLVSLSLESSPVADVTPIAQIVGIRSLNLRRTQVRDLGPLRNLDLSDRFYLDFDVEYLNNPKPD